MAMPALRPFTVDDLDALPVDGNRYEVLHGVLLVTPAAGLPHQTVASAINAKLQAVLRDEPWIRVWSPGVVVIHPDTQLEPDLLVGRLPNPSAEHRVPSAELRWENVEEHWLAVEVSGVGSRVYDREYKRDGYLEAGVAEVWLVDLGLKRILVSRAGGAKDVPHDVELTWRSPGGRETKLDVAAVFNLGPG